MTDWIGRTLGKVYIESLIARGGMAEVYLGTHTTLQRKVAVKILRNFNTEDFRPLERFELEARAVAKLRHPNIVQVFDYDSVDDQPYLVMEYISGPPLSKYLAALHGKNGRLGLPLVNRLFAKVAGALQYAHDSGVIHRDVKPGNILLISRSIHINPGETLPLDLEPILTDFGLVRFLNSSRQTTSGLITGTPAYMSPEQAMGEATDGRTDIYSLGIVLYEMLSGKVPFDGETTMSILLKHLHEAPPPVPGLSPSVQRVLDRALAKKPEDRFQHPDEFAWAFTTALENNSEAGTLVSIPQILGASKIRDLTPVKEHKVSMPILVTGALAILFGAFALFGGMLSGLRNGTTPTAISTNGTSFPGIPITMGPGSILHFQDGNAILDQAALIAQAMPAPPAGSRYEAWLIGGEQRLALGTLKVDQNGKGELTFTDSQHTNLLATYSGVEITIKSNSASDPQNAVYAYSLPEAGLVYLRNLMVTFPGQPERTGLIHGLVSNTKLVDDAATTMFTDHTNGNEAGAKQNAESIMNLLVGKESPDYRDWNGDGQVSDPGDGYGLIRNGTNLGYIQAVYSHADYAVNSPGATRNMIENGEDVKVCMQNLSRWVPELQENISTILNSTTLSGMDAIIRRSAELTDQILNGADLDDNGEIDPASEECGVLAAYETTYHMADMVLLPMTVNPQATPSQTVTPTLTATPPSNLFSTSTPTLKPDQNGSVPTVAPTDQPPVNPGEPARPTKKPKPTDEPGPNPGPLPDPKPTKNNPK